MRWGLAVSLLGSEASTPDLEFAAPSVDRPGVIRPADRASDLLRLGYPARREAEHTEIEASNGVRVTIPESSPMSNSWSGGQYSLVRAILGVYLLVRFAALLSFDAEVASSTAMAILGVAASLALLIGSHDRAAAWVVTVLWMSLFLRAPLVDHSGPLIVGFVVLLHASTPPRPFGSWQARGRVDPDSGWRMPPLIYLAAWIVMILGVVERGIAASGLPSQVGPSLLAAALFITGLVVWKTLRPGAWLGLLGTQFVLANFGDDMNLNAGLMLLQLFTFDPGWIRPRLPEHQTDQDPTLVFYDGTCGLCHRTIRFLLAEDAAGLRFRYATLDSDAFRSALREPESGFRPGDALPDSVVVHRPGTAMLTRASGALEIGHQLGGLWRLLAIVAGWIPISVLNHGYDFIARVRHRLFRRPDESCPLVPAELRDRFE